MHVCMGFVCLTTDQSEPQLKNSRPASRCSQGDLRGAILLDGSYWTMGERAMAYGLRHDSSARRVVPYIWSKRRKYTK